MDAAAERVLRAELVRGQEQARVTISRGVALIAVAPLVLFAAIVAGLALGGAGALMAGIIAATYLLVGSIAGMASIAAGLSEHRRCARELRVLDARYQLPRARLLLR